MQLQPVRTDLGGHLRAVHELLFHAVYVLARHGLRDLAHAVQILLLGRRHDRPVAVRQRQVGAVPRQAGGGLRARMADLHGELGIGVRVNPVRDALPALLLRFAVHTGATGRDAAFRAHAGHLGKHQPRTAHGTRAKVHEVEVARHAIDGRVLRHRRDHDAVLERQLAQFVGQEHRRRRDAVAIDLHAILLRQPLLVAAQPCSIAQAQVFVADALAAREHRIHELLGFELIAVALAADLEPLHRIPRGVLDAQRLDATRFLIRGEHFGDVLARVAQQLELAREFDGVFDGQLGARADREMRRVHGIAHQHDMAALAVLEPPLIAHHALEIDPRGAAQMARVGHQFRAVQIVCKQLFAERDGLLLIGSFEAAGLPGLFRGLDDEGRGLVVELVDMRLEPAMFGAHEIEGERLVDLVRAQPDVAIGARDDVGLEDVFVFAADARIHAVAGDDEVGIGVVLVALRIGVEHQFHTQLFATGLQNIEQMLAPDAHEAVAARADLAALEQQLDVVPVVERLLDFGGGDRIPLAHVVHGRVGEHHAPAEGVIGLVALHHRDVMVRVELLHQQREIQTSRPPADANDLHGFLPFREIALELNYLSLNDELR